MIHGIYVKSRPKGKWHLTTLTASPEAAICDMNKLKEQAKLDGNDTMEVGIQLYDSLFHIPEILFELKNQKVLYN